MKNIFGEVENEEEFVDVLTACDEDITQMMKVVNNYMMESFVGFL